MCRWSRNLGTSSSWSLSRPCNGTALPFFYRLLWIIMFNTHGDCCGGAARGYKAPSNGGHVANTYNPVNFDRPGQSMFLLWSVSTDLKIQTYLSLLEWRCSPRLHRTPQLMPERPPPVRRVGVAMPSSDSIAPPCRCPKLSSAACDPVPYSSLGLWTRTADWCRYPPWWCLHTTAHHI